MTELSSEDRVVRPQSRVVRAGGEYVPLPESGVEWMRGNQRLVFASGAALLAVIALLAIGIAVYNSRAEKASVAFGSAMQVYQTPLAAAGQQVPPGLKTFPNAAERAKVASGLFTQVAQQYGMTPDGRNARYFAGLSELEAGQTATAETTLKQVSGGWNRELGSLAKLALAQLYRGTMQNDKAVSVYQELTDKPTVSVPAGVAQLQLAELYEAENKPEAARKVYAALKDKDAKSAAGVIAAQKLNPSAAAPGGAS